MGRVRIAIRLCVACAACALAGCSFIVSQTAEVIDGSSRTVQLNVPAVTSCKSEVRSAMHFDALATKQPSRLDAEVRDLQDPAAAEALRFISEVHFDSTHPIGGLYQRTASIALGLPDPAASDPLNYTISRAKMRRELERAAKIAQERGFSTLAHRRVMLESSGSLSPQEAQTLESADFFQRYFEAYFRKGQIVSLKLNRVDAQARLEKDLTNAMHKADQPLGPDEKKTIAAAAKELLDIVCKADDCQLLDFADEKAFFVTRVGEQFSFPIVTVSFAPGAKKEIDVTKLDQVAVVGDLTRVFVEALFDAKLTAMPASSTSTGCNAKALFAHCVPPEEKSTTQDELADMKRAGDVTEAVSAYITAQLIRGGWFLSLNNEALAKAIETAISVSGRKGAEWAVWAANSCGTTTRLRKVDFVVGP